ncbi:sensor histidine kinase [Luteolibacter luteus]|uniref:histidine kinase n=1 Tax=Luteolibacter luteus TaxID=2728835 RepID=A0A858RFT0_9BACT|nr:HAMP domain-containing sensor histidine kinase [Luteolibacter luteus]QJE95150.1 HAMP domain-containing histidine kinase [Luteolibacter luteus]
MIPLALATYWWVKRSELAFPRLFWLFAAFIFSCGSTHLIEAVIFYEPVYRFSALMKVVTALVSWCTVFTLFRVAPKALELPGLQRVNTMLQEQLTVTKHAEEALERSNRDLSAFTGLVTHDLRNPLNSAVFVTEMAKESIQRGDSEQIPHLLDKALASLRQMEALVRELHAESMVRSVSGEMGVVPLSGVIESARLNLAPLIERSGARIEAEALPEVRGNRTMLVQLFINLLENSIKYRREEAPKIRIEASQTPDSTKIRVTDNGMGIPGDQLALIFESGFRAENSGGIPGSGLGLAFCRKIMEAHGGEISATSPSQGGATIDLVFKA